MKIGNEIFYKLYYSTLDIKIERAKEDLEIFDLTFISIKKLLESYKPYILSQVETPYGILMVSPSYYIKGKLSERYVANDTLYTKDVFMQYMKNYKKNFDRIKKHKEYIKELEHKKVSFKIYMKIIRKFNLKIAYEIVFRQYVFSLGYGIGKLLVTRSISKRDKINWNASNRKKAKLIEEGKIPYYAEDYKRAKEEGREYKGVKWLINHSRENIWITHKAVQITSYKFQLIKSNMTASLKNYLTELRGSKYFDIKQFPLSER